MGQRGGIRGGRCRGHVVGEALDDDGRGLGRGVMSCRPRVLVRLGVVPVRLCVVPVRLGVVPVRLCVVPVRLCVVPVRLCVVPVRLGVAVVMTRGAVLVMLDRHEVVVVLGLTVVPCGPVVLVVLGRGVVLVSLALVRRARQRFAHAVVVMPELSVPGHVQPRPELHAQQPHQRRDHGEGRAAQHRLHPRAGAAELGRWTHGVALVTSIEGRGAPDNRRFLGGTSLGRARIVRGPIERTRARPLPPRGSNDAPTGLVPPRG